jgi:radical SAM superfamily enzyme YgiQ (UPF0313 family)
MKIACVFLQPDLPTFWDIVPAPRYGTLLITSALQQAGFDVVGLVENISTNIEAKAEKADIIGFTILSACADKTYKLADKLRKQGKIVIFGGSHAHYFPEDCLKHCDYIVLGDGEIALVKLVKALNSSKPIDKISGISWMENGQVKKNPREPNPERYKGIIDLTLIKDYPAFIRRHKWLGWAPIVFQATRGCPYNCKFCVTQDLFGKKYYTRDIEEVIEDLKDKLRYSKDIYFVDNNIAGNIKYTRQLVEAIINEKISMNATAYVRHDFSRQTDLLRLMRQAGFTRLLVGVESFIDGTLKEFEKHQDFKSVQESIKTFRRYGFRTSGTFIMGLGEETPATSVMYLDVARKLNLDFAFFFIYGIYPHMCSESMPKERIFFNDLKYGTGHFIFFFPEKIRPSRLQNELLKAHLGFYSIGRIFNRLVRGKWKDVAELILHRILFLRMRRHVKQYEEYLRELENGLYKKDILDIKALLKKNIPRLSYYG